MGVAGAGFSPRASAVSGLGARQGESTVSDKGRFGRGLRE
jgi:hypothetical protein